MLRDRTRIVVVGTSGSGKTNLARQLAQILDRACIELDALYWGLDATVRVRRTRAACHPRRGMGGRSERYGGLFPGKRSSPTTVNPSAAHFLRLMVFPGGSYGHIARGGASILWCFLSRAINTWNSSNSHRITRPLLSCIWKPHTSLPPTNAMSTRIVIEPKMAIASGGAHFCLFVERALRTGRRCTRSPRSGQCPYGSGECYSGSVRVFRQRAKATTAQIISTRPKGHAP